MTVELAALLIGLTTVLFCSCVYATILHDKLKIFVDFITIEMMRFEANAGNVLVTDRETGDTFFCDANEYLDNKSKYELDSSFGIISEDKNEK